MTNGWTIVSPRPTATAEQLRTEIEQRLKAGAETEKRCHGCETPHPVMLPERRGDGVNWTVAAFPHVPLGCAAFMMKVLSEVMFTYDLVPSSPAPATEEQERKRSSMVVRVRRKVGRSARRPALAAGTPRPRADDMDR